MLAVLGTYVAAKLRGIAISEEALTELAKSQLEQRKVK
jgi:hypothetical protein